VVPREEDLYAPPREIQDLIRQKGEESDRMARRVEQLSQAQLELAFRPSPQSPMPRLQNIPRPPLMQSSNVAAIAPLMLFMGFFAGKGARDPALAGMKAMEGFAEGVQAGDQDRMKREQQNWENAQTQIIQNNTIERQRVQAIQHNQALTMRDRAAQIQALAAASKDELVASALRTGKWDDALKFYEDRWKVTQQLQSKERISAARTKLEPTDRVLYDNWERDFIRENGRNPTDGEQMEKYRQIQTAKSTRGPGPIDQQLYKTKLDAIREREKREPTPDEAEQAARESREATRAPPRGPLSEGATIAAETERRRQDLIKQGVEPQEAFRQASASVRQDMPQVPKGTLQSQLRHRVEMLENAGNALNRAEALLNRRGITGAGGAITRPLESAANWVGMTDTDRRQFEREIAELKEWAPMIVAYRAGRPLAAEEGKINKIVPGLAVGDTAANTRRQFQQLRELFNDMHTRTVDELEGRWQPGAMPAAPGKGGKAAPALGGSKRPAWEEAPKAE